VVNQSLMNTTILLLVSDPIVRSILKETLEHEGYTVVADGDLGQAADRIKECPPDLPITRTYIEGLSGHDAAMYLRTKCLEMKVLILGGFLMTSGFNLAKLCKDLMSSQDRMPLRADSRSEAHPEQTAARLNACPAPERLRTAVFQPGAERFELLVRSFSH
jgi:CheY-like chemotaxis protein